MAVEEIYFLDLKKLRASNYHMFSFVHAFIREFRNKYLC